MRQRDKKRYVGRVGIAEEYSLKEEVEGMRFVKLKLKDGEVYYESEGARLYSSQEFEKLKIHHS